MLTKPGNNKLKTPYAVVVAVLAVLLIAVFCMLLFLRSRRKFKKAVPETPNYPSFAQGKDQAFEMREASLGEWPQESYEGTRLYPLDVNTQEPLAPPIPGPYSATVPYTPASTVTPNTPNS